MKQKKAKKKADKRRRQKASRQLAAQKKARTVHFGGVHVREFERSLGGGGGIPERGGWALGLGPLLLPSKITRKNEPAHEGIDFELPGHLMIKLAPLLYVFSKLLEIASSAGNLMGVPLPSNVPGLGSLKYLPERVTFPSLHSTRSNHR